MSTDKPPQKPYASPVCYAHELDPIYRDQANPDSDAWRDVNRWRRAERERLGALRNRLTRAERRAGEACIAERLTALLVEYGRERIGVYWPIRGEPDLRKWMQIQAESGFTIALPIVLAADKPLRYSVWRPGDPMTRGVWGIAVPARPEWVEPELVIAPVVGIDGDNYRLGNGGGYFDRTLAATKPKPRCIGVGFACARIPTIYPQAHDIPMDEVVIASPPGKAEARAGADN